MGQISFNLSDTSDFREKQIKPRDLPRDRTQKQRYYVEETNKTATAHVLFSLPFLFVDHAVNVRIIHCIFMRYYLLKEI